MIAAKNTIRYGRVIVSFLAAVFVVSLWCLSLGGDVVTHVVTASEFLDLPELEVPEPVQPADYSKFRHSNQYHSRLPCLVCHVRSDNSARIGFPGRNSHLPCAGCHALQFSDSSSPICTICHSNSQTGAMKAFPGLRSFGAKFDHSRHGRVNCATCHTSAARGVARNIPSGRSAHTTCFQCHTASSSNAMASCSTCHQAGRLVRVS